MSPCLINDRSNRIHRAIRLMTLLVVVFLLAFSGAQAQFDHELKLEMSEYTQHTWYGCAVAVSDEFAVVGAANGFVNGEQCGAAYVFQKVAPGDRWEEVKKLTASDPHYNDRFGSSVAICNEDIIVGAGNKGGGRAYIFSRHQGGTDNWGQVKELVSHDIDIGDGFGGSVGIDGDFALVGACKDDDNGDYSGSAYLFHRNHEGPGQWGEVKKLLPGDGKKDDYFGVCVSISNKTLIVSAARSSASSDPGAVYIFERDEGGHDNWGEIKKLQPDGLEEGDQYALSICIDRDTIVVGAYGDDDIANVAGAAYVFTRNQGGAGNWGLVKKLLPDNGHEYYCFGYSVAVDGDGILVGAAITDELHYHPGAAHIFERDEGGANHWGELKRLHASDGFFGDAFGCAVGLDQGNAIVGDCSRSSKPGDSAYLFNQPVGRHIQVLPKDNRLFEVIGESAVKTLSVTSVGTEDLTIDSIAGLGSKFEITNLPSLPLALSPGETLPLELRYTPSEAGADHVWVTINSDDRNDPISTVLLEGTGLNPANPGVCYAVCYDSSSPAKVLVVDLDSGNCRALRHDNGTKYFTSIAIDSKGGIFAAGSSSEKLYRIDGVTGEAYLLYRTREFDAIAFDDSDALYGTEFGVWSSGWCSIDVSTGKTDYLGYMGLHFGGLAFDPMDGTLYASSSEFIPNQIYTLDKNTGEKTLVGEVGIGFITLDIAIDREGRMFGMLSRDYTGPCNLISIDKNTGAGSPIGPAGFENIYGLEIAPPAPLMADRYTLSATSVSELNFRIDAGEDNAGRNYLLLGSASGCVPGTPLPNEAATLPINWDGFTAMVLMQMNSIFFKGFFGVLDAAGTATAVLRTRPIPGWQGGQMHFAYCLGYPFDYASNFVRVEIFP